MIGIASSSVFYIGYIIIVRNDLIGLAKFTAILFQITTE